MATIARRGVGAICALISVGAIAAIACGKSTAAPTAAEPAPASSAAAEGIQGKSAGEALAPLGAREARAPSRPRPGPLAAAAPPPEARPAGVIGSLDSLVQSGPGDGPGSGGGGMGAPAPMPRLDPNARYATTYRPGGAALAAFDAAVGKGAIPLAYKDLVGDFGARYAPQIARPATAALAFQIDTERAQMAPAGGTLNLRVAIRSSDAMPARAPLSVHLVLDVSGSMSGTAIDNARKAAETLVQRLGPQDDFSMVTFSSDADLLVNDGPIGARKAQILSKIHEVKADGGTNISAGLDLGYKEAHSPSIGPDAVKIVMLLSDGHANAGDSRPAALAERSASAFQDGIQTSSFGLGADFDAALMSSIADRGAGGYYYLADSSQIAPALNHELDARLVPVAQGVEVRVRLRPDVTPIKVYGSRMLDGAEAAQVRQQEVVVDQNAKKRDNIKQDRQTDAEGGMRFFMPSFSRDDRHAMLITLLLPPGVGDKAIGSVEVRYKDRLQKKNVTEEISVKTRYAVTDGDSAASTNASVAATVQAFAAGDTILRAAEQLDRGDRAGAARMLTERADLLKRAATTLAEPKLADDALRLARLSEAVNGVQMVQDPLPLAVMLRGSGYGYLR